MFKRIVLGASCFFVFISCSHFLIPLSPGDARAFKPKDVAACVRNPDCRETFVVSHRGRGFGAPENSEEAVRRAVVAGIPFIEVDLRYSKDQVLHCFHDRSLKRMTGRGGNLSDYLSGELALMELGDSEEKIAQFYGVYKIAKGRAILILDFKQDAVEYLARWVSLYGSFDDIVFYASSKKEMESAALAKKSYPGMIIMAELGSLDDIEGLKIIFGSLPEILHIHFPLTLVSSAKLRSFRTKLFADSLAAPLPLQIIPLSLLLAAHVDFIEVDRPIFLKKLIEAMNEF